MREGELDPARHRDLGGDAVALELSSHAIDQERHAGLAIDVDRAGLGVGDRLAAGGRGAHAVELTIVHSRGD